MARSIKADWEEFWEGAARDGVLQKLLPDMQIAFFTGVAVTVTRIEDDFSLTIEELLRKIMKEADEVKSQIIKDDLERN